MGADDDISVGQALARGAAHLFPPPLGTFISTLNQRRAAGGRGLSGTLGSTQRIKDGELMASSFSLLAGTSDLSFDVDLSFPI